MEPDGSLPCFTRARHWSLSWARWIQSTPHLICPKYILILSPHIDLGLRSGLFVSCFLIKILYRSIIASMRATWFAHVNLLDLITPEIFVGVCNLWSPLLWSPLQPPATSFPLGPNILLSTLLNTFSSCSSFSVTDRVLHPYRSPSKIVVLCI